MAASMWASRQPCARLESWKASIADGDTMKISIIIDDALMAAAMQASQLGSRQKTIELAVRTLVQLRQEETLRPWRGKLRWDGDLEGMRLDADTKGSFQAIHGMLTGKTNGARLSIEQINDAIADASVRADAGSQ